MMFALAACSHACVSIDGGGALTRESLQMQIDAADPGGVIVLPAGVYALDAPLRLNKPVTLRAASGADVLLSGGRRLALDWHVHQGGVMRAKLSEDLELDAVAFDQLFLDGQLLHLARFPDFDAKAHFFGGTSADAMSPERVATWQDPAGGFIHSLHRAQWGGNHWRITGKNSDGTLALEGGYMNNRPSGINPKHRFVENVFEELDGTVDRRAGFECDHDGEDSNLFFLEVW